MKSEFAHYFFIFALGIGSAITWFSDDGVTYVYFDNSRKPAAIRRVFDFSHLKGNDLRIASQKRLLSDAKLFKTETSVGIELGHFVLKGLSGKKEFACQSFDHVELTFAAQGVAESGHPPKMYVKGECRMGDDISRIAPIWIPMADLMAEKPTVDVVKYEDSPLTIWFENMGTMWPKNWTLESARLFKSGEPGHQVFIGKREVHEIVRDQISFRWEAQKNQSTE